jgi:alpha-N-acetylglucosaminidase
MALSGVINPLALVGQDAIWLDTFANDFGLPKEQLLGEFFAGPTFSPWHWMGNLNGWGGPVDEAFLRQQLALQQNITSAMSAFGMRPVLPAFAGHVPRSLQDKYPQANITQLKPWHGHMPNGTYFLSPTSELFRQIGEKFVTRQAQALGVAQWSAPHHYLADAYNEMPPPPESTPAFLASVSRSMFESMAAADSDARMVTQVCECTHHHRAAVGQYIYPPATRHTPHTTQSQSEHIPPRQSHSAPTLWHCGTVPSAQSHSVGTCMANTVGGGTTEGGVGA